MIRIAQVVTCRLSEAVPVALFHLPSIVEQGFHDAHDSCHSIVLRSSSTCSRLGQQQQPSSSTCVSAPASAPCLLSARSSYSTAHATSTHSPSAAPSNPSGGIANSHPLPSCLHPSPNSPEVYTLTITVQAFEPRFLNATLNTVRDLLFITLAPKSLAALRPPGPRPVKSHPTRAQPPTPAASAASRAPTFGASLADRLRDALRAAPPHAVEGQLQGVSGKRAKRARPRRLGFARSRGGQAVRARTREGAAGRTVVGNLVGPPVQLFLPLRARTLRVNWKKTRFTVIKSPFIDKTGMEQFEQRSYKASVCASTNSPLEMEWAMEALKVHDFPGVQLTVDVTAPAHLTPRAAPHAQATDARLPATPLSGLPTDTPLGAHLARMAPDLVLPPGGSGADVTAAARMQEQLHTLRGVLLAGMERRRMQLSGNSEYARWHDQHRAAPPPDGLDLPPGPLAPPQHSASLSGVDLAQALACMRMDQVATMLHAPFASVQPPPVTPMATTTSMGAAADLQGLLHLGDAAAAGAPPPHAQALAFLAAADAALLDLSLAAVQDPVAAAAVRFATHPCDGSHPVPAAWWMHAVFKVSQLQQRVVALQAASAVGSGTEADLARAYGMYGAYSQVLLQQLLRLWWEERSKQVSDHLALPSRKWVADAAKNRASSS